MNFFAPTPGKARCILVHPVVTSATLKRRLLDLRTRSVSFNLESQFRQRKFLLMVFEEKLSRRKFFIATACQDDILKLDDCRVNGKSLETIQISHGEIRFPSFPTRLVRSNRFVTAA